MFLDAICIGWKYYSQLPLHFCRDHRFEKRSSPEMVPGGPTSTSSTSPNSAIYVEAGQGSSHRGQEMSLQRLQKFHQSIRTGDHCASASEWWRRKRVGWWEAPIFWGQVYSLQISDLNPNNCGLDYGFLVKYAVFGFVQGKLTTEGYGGYAFNSENFRNQQWRYPHRNTLRRVGQGSFAKRGSLTWIASLDIRNNFCRLIWFLGCNPRTNFI